MKGVLQLDFDTKFEIQRTPVKKESEDDDRLGDIIGMTLTREGVQKEYRL